MSLPIVSEGLSRQLQLCLEKGCSDLHLSVNSPPVGRLHGLLVRLGEKVWNEADIDELIDGILKPDSVQQLRETGRSVDTACSAMGQRFRLNIFRERGSSALAIRRLEPRIPSPEELNLPPELTELTTFPHGLVLVTGPTGSGKSTTLATLLNIINHQRACHILTIEDPVEYLHSNHQGLVRQREVGTDAVSFSDALREAMREDPDVILVGEMRDLPTARAALTAAETGHLVFSTLHCGDSVGALDRILALFPASEEGFARRQLGQTLRAVLAQALMPRIDKPGRVPAVELLRCTPAVQNLIRTGQFPQLYTALETGRAHGMISYESSLAALVGMGRINRETARSHVRNERLFDQLIARSL